MDVSQAAQLASNLLTAAAAATRSDPIAEALKSILAQVTSIASSVSGSAQASQQSASAAVNNLVKQFNAYNALLLSQQLTRASDAQSSNRYRATRASLYATKTAPGSTGTYKSLYQVGVRQDANGTMRVAHDSLYAAAQHDAASVFALVRGDGSKERGGLLGLLSTEVSSLVTSYAVSATNAAASGSLLGATTAIGTDDEAQGLTDYYRALAAV